MTEINGAYIIFEGKFELFVTSSQIYFYYNGIKQQELLAKPKHKLTYKDAKRWIRLPKMCDIEDLNDFSKLLSELSILEKKDKQKQQKILEPPEILPEKNGRENGQMVYV
jgi:hypothetical protein